MFQLEILDARIFEKWSREDVVVYLVACRAVVGDFPMGSYPVWVYETGRPIVKAFMSYVRAHPRDVDYSDMARIFGPQDKEVYVLYVTPGEEIAVGMMISDVPPEALQGHTGE